MTCRRRSAVHRCRCRRESSATFAARWPAFVAGASFCCSKGGQDGFAQPLFVDWLEQVIDRLFVEGFDGILVVGGDKHDASRALPALHPARSGRASDIEKRHVWLQVRRAAAAHRCHWRLRMTICSSGHSCCNCRRSAHKQQRFVVGDHGGGQVMAKGRANGNGAVRPVICQLQVAASPNSARRRWRILFSPTLPTSPFAWVPMPLPLSATESCSRSLTAWPTA